MSLLNDLQGNAQQEQMAIQRIIAEIDQLASEGHKVEAKGTQAAYIDDHLMIFLYAGVYENHQTGVRGEFEAGKIRELLK